MTAVSRRSPGTTAGGLRCGDHLGWAEERVARQHHALQLHLLGRGQPDWRRQLERCCGGTPPAQRIQQPVGAAAVFGNRHGGQDATVVDQSHVQAALLARPIPGLVPRRAGRPDVHQYLHPVQVVGGLRTQQHIASGGLLLPRDSHKSIAY
jgi:hypothetical protein